MAAFFRQSRSVARDSFGRVKVKNRGWSIPNSGATVSIQYKLKRVPVMIVGFHFPHKTASMFAHKIMQTVSAELGLKYFSQNQVPATHTQLCDLSNEQICGEEVFLRGPVRNFTVLQSLDGLDIDAALRFSTPASFLNGNYKAVCQRRDVLDLVVSQYFSHGWIHPPANGFGERRKEIQAGKISVFEYALLEFEGLADFGQDSILDKYNDLSLSLIHI